MNQFDELLTPITDETNSFAAEVAEEVAAAEEVVVEKVKRERSKKYVAARGQVDRTKSYALTDAIEILKNTSYSSFDGTVTAHFNLRKEIKPFEVTLPHATGKSIRVAIANADLIAEIESGVMNFDILLATPDMMPKLVKLARVLGPKGLMPNPKTGTVTSDPEAKKALLEGGAQTIKPERKAPLVHVTVGKTNQPTTELAENIEALIKVINPAVITKLTLAPTMGPGVKVTVVAPTV